MAFDYSKLLMLEPPWLIPFVGSADDVTGLAWVCDSEISPPDRLFEGKLRLDGRIVSRVLRGKKMTSYEKVFDEFAAAFQFPSYFGENWGALDEYISDLSWLPSEAYVVIVQDAAAALEVDDQNARALLRVFTTACEEWSKPISLGEWWDRPGRPFHVVLHAMPEEFPRLKERVSTLGYGFG